MIAIQTVLNKNGEKPTSELSWSFKSVVNTSLKTFGMDTSGIYDLTHVNPDEASFESAVTLATTNLNSMQVKSGRFLYIGLSAEKSTVLNISIRFDGLPIADYSYTMKKSGLQRIRIPLGSRNIGVFVSVRLATTGAFKLSNIECLFLIIKH